MSGQMFFISIFASIKSLQFYFFQKLPNCLFILFSLLKCHPSDLPLRSPVQSEFLNPRQAIHIFSIPNAQNLLSLNFSFWQKRNLGEV